MQPLPGTHHHAAFNHLADERYASGYYAYLWSFVIAKDLFSAFDPDDLQSAGTAHRYRDRVLAAGGSRDGHDLVQDFLGRPLSPDRSTSGSREDEGSDAPPPDEVVWPTPPRSGRNRPSRVGRDERCRKGPSRRVMEP